jgi:EAL domain-containing protein (putative c-di-GMP-specific phosphodiesterase class I)
VRGLPDDSSNAAIAGAIVALGNSLGLTVIAEGVESAAEEEFLRDLGCHLGQGFYYAKPMPAAELTEWARARDTEA